MAEQLNLFGLASAATTTNGKMPMGKALDAPALGRSGNLHMARAYLSQARHARLNAARRGADNRSWVAVLLGWAAARRVAGQQGMAHG